MTERNRAPNMDNKIAFIWRDNVMKLMDFYQLSIADMCDVTGKSSSTIQSNFGGTKLVGTPSKSTITTIERAFALNVGTLGRPNFNPNNEEDMINPKAAPVEQLATLNLPIPAHKLERIMRILLDDD